MKALRSVPSPDDEPRNRSLARPIVVGLSMVALGLGFSGDQQPSERTGGMSPIPSHTDGFSGSKIKSIDNGDNQPPQPSVDPDKR